MLYMYIYSNIAMVGVFKQKILQILLMYIIYKLQVLIETYEIDVKIIASKKQINKAHINLFCFLL